MQVKLTKSAGSLSIKLPKEVVDKLSLKNGDFVELDFENSSLVVTKVPPKEPELVTMDVKHTYTPISFDDLMKPFSPLAAPKTKKTRI